LFVAVCRSGPYDVEIVVSWGFVMAYIKGDVKLISGSQHRVLSWQLDEVAIYLQWNFNSKGYLMDSIY
jgi:hypothetical protein